jgi:hypothetical protein
MEFLNNKKNFITFLNILIVFAVIVSVFGIYRDYKNTIIYGGTDLRVQVTHARVMLQGRDPYTFIWNEKESDLLLMPVEPSNLPYANITISPTTLLLRSTVANLSYKFQRYSWSILQWLLLLASIAFISKSTNSPYKSRLIWIFGLIFVAGSVFWRLHVERGQVYILYVFIASLALWILSRETKTADIIGGIVLGILFCIRPPMVLIAVPFLIYKKWKVLIGEIIGGIIGIFSPMILGGFKIWNSYFTNSQGYGTWYTNPRTVELQYNFPNRVIEGMSNIGKMADIPAADTSFESIVRDYLRFFVSTKMLAVILVIAVLCFSIFALSLKIKKLSISGIFLIGIFFASICEYMLPAPRFSYQDVIWLLSISLIILSFKLSDLAKSYFNILLFAGLFFSISYTYVPGGLRFGDILIILYVFAMAAVMLIKQKKSKEVLIETGN